MKNVLCRSLPALFLALLFACSSSSGGAAGASQSQKELSDGTVGSACGACGGDFQCSSGAGVPNGYCTKGCAADGECGGSGRCVSTANGAFCFRGCQSDSECRPGYACKNAGSYSVCDVGTPAGTQNPGAGTCDASCAHYLGCKGINDAASTQSCVASCQQKGFSSKDLAAFEQTDCATAINTVDGTPSTNTGGNACYECQWDGSACAFMGSNTYAGMNSYCDPGCCK